MRDGKGASSALGLTLTLVLAAGFCAGVSAHRLDEYLQAARIDVEPRRVDLQLDLTPGIAVAERIVHDVDRDRDGAFSAFEERAYVDRVLRRLQVEADGTRIPLERVSFVFPTLAALRSGVGTIRVQAAAALPVAAAGEHRLRFANANWPEMSVYLANALVPASDRIAVIAQNRDVAQADLTIVYVIHPEASRHGLLWLSGGATLAVALAGLAGLIVLPAHRKPTGGDASPRSATY